MKIEKSQFVLNTRLCSKNLYYSFSQGNCNINLTMHYYKKNIPLNMWSEVLMVGLPVKAGARSNKKDLGCVFQNFFEKQK